MSAERKGSLFGFPVVVLARDAEEEKAAELVLGPFLQRQVFHLKDGRDGGAEVLFDGIIRHSMNSDTGTIDVNVGYIRIIDRIKAGTPEGAD